MTHVACLPGHAATQLLSFVQEARAGRLTSLGATPEQQIAGLARRWEDIMAHRDDSDRMWLGHALPALGVILSRGRFLVYSSVRASTNQRSGGLKELRVSEAQELVMEAALLAPRLRCADFRYYEGRSIFLRCKNTERVRTPSKRAPIDCGSWRTRNVSSLTKLRREGAGWRLELPPSVELR